MRMRIEPTIWRICRRGFKHLQTHLKSCLHAELYEFCLQTVLHIKFCQGYQRINIEHAQ